MADERSGPSSKLKRKRPSKEESPSKTHNRIQASRNLEMLADQGTSGNFEGFVAESISILETSNMGDFVECLCRTLDRFLGLNTTPEFESFSKALSQILRFNPLVPAQLLDIINQIWNDQPRESKVSLRTLLQTLIDSNILTTELAIELIDREILQDLALISNSQIFSTRSVRVNTSLLYKQQKFNLLREENEGYGKLSHEFNLALSELPKAGLMDASEIASRSEDLLTVVNALIGYFELDPNRVLDNILDICSQNLLSHTRFMMHFLHHSPWAPSALATAIPFALAGETEKRRRLDSIQSDFVKYYRAEMCREGGSRLAAELLGFKLRYCSSATSHRSSAAPESLIFLTALLIKSGFIKLSDIYPYLIPTDDELKSEYRKWKEEMDDRAFMAKSNPLALAGALGDDETGDGISDKPKSTEMNQKVSLLHALLAVGCIPAALQLLSLHPQISGPHQFVSDGIHRLLHVAIEPVYRPYSPSSNFEQHTLERLEMQKRRAVTSRTAIGAVEWLDDLERRSVRGYSPFPKQEFGDRKVRFFLDEDIWTIDIPICETLDDFYAIAINLLRFSGPRLGNDVNLLVKLARIGKGQFIDGSKQPLLLHRWIEISRLCLIPAISLVGPNPGVVNEAYDLIKNFPYSTRFSLYGEWQTVAYKMHPELKLKASETDKDTKGILRRISKQDVKRFGRALAKKSTSNPLILWAIAINQIEYYDNFVEVVVDAAKFCTNLGYDVLEFVILSSLANPFKNRVKEDGTSIAVWLTGLSSFCAKLFRRYPSMDVSTATTYVACQLKRSNIYDLIVLRDLVTQMAGVLVRENLSDHQLKCYAGGDSLKDQGMALLREPGMVLGWKKSGARLMKALTEANLVGLLSVLIAQERGTSLYNLRTEHTSNLKLLGNLFDECHGVLIQFHEFVVSNLDLVAFETLLPSFETLVELYGIDPSVAFYLWRPIIAQQIKQNDADQAIQMQKQKLLKGLAANENSRILQENEKSSASTSRDNIPESSATPDDKLLDLEKSEENLLSRSSIETPWHPALHEFIQEASRVLPTEVWAYMSPHFYTTFWQLTLYDISVPMQTYTQEVSKLTNEIKKKDADRSDMTPTAVQRRRRERERLQSLIDQLNQDFKAQTAAYQTTKERLSKEKDFWFDEMKPTSASETVPPRNRTVLAMLQHCVIPRCLFGPNEAIFCAKFVREMHKLGAKNFSTLTLFDKLFVNLHDTVIFTCTNREAENYGRFLRETLGELARWYGDRSTYEKEAIGSSTPGFLKKWNINPSEAIYLQYEEFRSVMFKWHKFMTTGFRACLESRDYMHVRNALAVLEKIINYYPQVDFHGNILEEKVNLIASKSETRGDLQIRAQGYLALLRKSSKSLVTAAKFGAPSKPVASPLYSASPKKLATPQISSPETGASSITTEKQPSERVRSNLNPSAPSFKPQDDNRNTSIHQRVQPEVADVSSPRGQDQTPRASGNEHAARQDRTDFPVGRGVRTETSHQPSVRTTRNSAEDVRDDSARSRTATSREEATRRSRVSNQSDPEQKPSNARSDRSSRVKSDSKAVVKDEPRIPLSRDADTQARTGGRQEAASSARMDFNSTSTDSIQTSRNRSDGSIPGQGGADNRPRTPEGPRGNDNGQTSSPNVRGSGQRDVPPTRPMRYEAARSNNPPLRSGQGFRAPPPTGPRASTVPSISAQGSTLSAARTQGSARTAANNDFPRGPTTSGPRSTPPPERSDVTSSTRSTGPGMNPDRAAMLGLSSRESDAIALTNSGSARESSIGRNRTASIEGPVRSSSKENLHPSDAPRGPSDWKGRAKRDIQDEDPRRLSRGPDTWEHAPPESERQGHRLDETGRSVVPKSYESQKESSTSKSRAAHDKDVEEPDDPSRTTQRSRTANRNDVPNARRTRATSTGNRETDVRPLRSSGHNTQSNNHMVTNTTENKAEISVAGREKEDSSSHNHKGRESSARRAPLGVTPSREQKEVPRDSKTTSHRGDDDSLHRRDERETTRSRKDDSRDSRHDRSRDVHHLRASTRRSPSRSNSDRAEKKDRERESDRRNGSRRDGRESEHRDKDRPVREFEHRRDGRDRDRSGRDRETESRRGSRKHERDRSAEALDRGTRPGEAGESSITGDSLLPNKRRRVVR